MPEPRASTCRFASAAQAETKAATGCTVPPDLPEESPWLCRGCTTKLSERLPACSALRLAGHEREAASERKAETAREISCDKANRNPDKAIMSAVFLTNAIS